MTGEARSGEVLIIEDEPSLATLYGQLLESSYSVRIAFDGAQGLELMDDEVDVILLDRRMPDLTGREVLSEIRRHYDRCRVAIITAAFPDVDVIDMGFDEYIIKPISGNDLRELVDRLVVRASYDEDIRRLLAMASKRSVLEANTSVAVLEEHRKYRSLVDGMDALEERLRDDLADLDEAAIGAWFRIID